MSGPSTQPRASTRQLELPNMPPRRMAADVAWERWRKTQAAKARIRRFLEASRKLQDERQGTPATRAYGLLLAARRTCPELSPANKEVRHQRA